MAGDLLCPEDEAEGMWPLPHSVGSHMHALCLQVTLTIAALGKKEDLQSQVLGKVSVPIHHAPFRYIGQGTILAHQ